VILFRFGRAYAHGGIVTIPEPLTMVHAYAGARVVLEEEVERNSELLARLPGARFASYWGPPAA
jgi:hypothetical protein